MRINLTGLDRSTTTPGKLVHRGRGGLNRHLQPGRILPSPLERQHARLPSPSVTSLLRYGFQGGDAELPAMPATVKPNVRNTYLDQLAETLASTVPPSNHHVSHEDEQVRPGTGIRNWIPDSRVSKE